MMTAFTTESLRKGVRQPLPGARSALGCVDGKPTYGGEVFYRLEGGTLVPLVIDEDTGKQTPAYPTR